MNSKHTSARHVKTRTPHATSRSRLYHFQYNFSSPLSVFGQRAFLSLGSTTSHQHRCAQTNWTPTGTGLSIQVRRWCWPNPLRVNVVTRKSKHTVFVRENCGYVPKRCTTRIRCTRVTIARDSESDYPFNPIGQFHRICAGLQFSPFL